MLKIPGLVIGLILLSACGVLGGGATQGSGTITSETRPISGISSVVLTTSGNMTLSLGETASLTIESDDNILPLLTSDVSNGVLTLGTRPDAMIQATRIQYMLVVTDLTALTNTGSGNITAGELNGQNFALKVDGSGDVAIEALNSAANPNIEVTGSGNVIVRFIEADNLTVTQTGSGGMTLSGRTTSQNVTLSGSGDYNGDGLQTESATIALSASGDASVNVSTSLNATISGSGNLTYGGSPTVNENITGSGEVIQRQ